jgi:hypothetical protein
MNYLIETEGKDTSFITPKGRRAYEAFQESHLGRFGMGTVRMGAEGGW